MKFLQFTLVLAALLASACALSSTWGAKNYTDALLMNEAVNRYAVAGVYSTADVVFPKSGQTNNLTITAIYVYDLAANNTGAVASLWSGGPGYKFATLNFKSQYGKAINSTVQIYGK